MASLSELIVPQTKDTVLGMLLGYLSLKGFPVNTWKDGFVSKDIVEWISAYLSDATALVGLVAKSGFLALSERDWLELVARGFYAEDRLAAIASVNYLTLTNTTGSPIVVSATSIFETASGIQFRGGGVTVGAGGVQTITVSADIPGGAGNVGLNQITVVRTSYPGMTCTNAPDAFTGTSLITTGTDRESDELLRARCRAKWGALGTGGTKEAYVYWCRTATPSCTKVMVFPSSPSAGYARVIVGNASGPLSLTDYLLVVDYVADRVPLCVTAAVENCLTAPISVLGSVYYDETATLSSLKAAVAANFYSIQSTKQFGDPLFVAEIIEAIMTPPGVKNCSITYPIADVSPATNAMHILNDPSSLDWTPVKA